MIASEKAMKQPAPKEESRFAECRRRVAAGCGGKHIDGKEFAGGTFSHWICCPDCPNYAETNSPTRQPKPVSRSVP
jgi:hypothetical protein